MQASSRNEGAETRVVTPPPFKRTETSIDAIVRKNNPVRVGSGLKPPTSTSIATHPKVTMAATESSRWPR